MNTASIVILVFGLFSLTGGLIGYFKAGSMPSLLAGVISGLILLVCSYGLSKGSTIAAIVSIVIAILLGGRFFSTIMKNFKVMPDLIMILLSIFAMIAVIFHLIKK